MLSLQISTAPREPAPQASPCGFRTKQKDLETGFSLLTVQKMEQEPKKETGGRERGGFLPFPPPPSSFTRPIFAHLFFAPKAHGNARYRATQAIYSVAVLFQFNIII